MLKILVSAKLKIAQAAGYLSPDWLLAGTMPDNVRASRKPAVKKGAAKKPTKKKAAKKKAAKR
jgi:hypothetical protein